MMPAAAATAWAEGTDLSTCTVTLAPDSALYTGTEHKLSGDEGTVKVNLTVKSSGKTLERGTDYDVAWSQGETTNGTPKDAGAYTLTVTGKNSYSGTITKTYTVKQVDLSNATIECSALTTSDFPSQAVDEKKGWENIETGETINSLPSGKTMTVRVGSETVASSIYKTTITKLNGYQIQVKVEPAEDQDSKNINGTRYATFNVTTELTDSTYEVVGTNGKALADMTYTGKALTPSVYVVPISSAGDTTVNRLTEGTDYKVSYSNNVNGNSDATVTITGLNKYSGTVTGSFHINGKSLSSCSITVGNTVEGNEPEVAVYDGSEKLVKGTDYDVTYTTSSTGSSAGSVTITGKGNYEGTRTASFSVVEAGYDISQAAVSAYNYSYKTKTYTGSAQYPDYLTVTMTKSGSSTKTLTKDTDYTVAYEYTKDGKTYTTTSPKDAYTYTIKITGKGSYGGVKDGGSFTISPYNLKDANISVTVASATSTPSVSVRTAGGTYFTKDVDYTLRYTPNYNKTKVTVTLSGMGTNLTGYYSKDYSVNSTSISYCTLSFSDNKTNAAYTGYTIPKTVVVKYGSATLTQGSDYDLTIKNAAGTTVSSVKDAGTYTFTVTGKNGWYGSSSITFTVTGNDISAYNVILDKTSISATGSNVALPKVTRVYSGSSVLSTSEYTVSYQNAAGTTVTSAYAPGTYKVVVTGAGKYSGSTNATFTIVGKTQSITGVSSTYKKYKTSKAFQLSPSATEGSFTYTSSDSSVATVSSTGLVTPLKAGRAKITIKTTGNSKYNPAEYSTVIKVYPNKAVLTQKPWTAGDSKIKVRWNKQEGATRYEVRYSRVKSFASGTYLTKKVDAAVNDYDTQSTTLKNLASGSKYYVKVRAVTEVYNDYGKKLTYYGNWSKWKSVVAE